MNTLACLIIKNNPLSQPCYKRGKDKIRGSLDTRLPLIVTYGSVS